jgi:3-dehydroquinate dehydratase-2
MRVMVINGPNLNMLGIREPEIYGNKTYEDLIHYMEGAAEALDVEIVEFYQSNHEGDLVDAIQRAYGTCDGIVINPGAYTHTSIALLDAVKTVGLPVVEVHISDPDKRETFRKRSYIRRACIATVKGMGLDGYIEALKILTKFTRQ